jgi:glutathione S-transferase
MLLLIHFPLDPASRKVRILLKEKGLAFDLREERPWERREEFLAMSPAGDLPVLVETDGKPIADVGAIVEYLEETGSTPSLYGSEPRARAEVRRLAAWFDRKFQREVTTNLLDEKIGRRIMGKGTPDSSAIRAGILNLKTHLDYIAWLADRRNWLAGDNFSMADISAAAQLSCIDYLGDVPWDDHAGARDWYQRVKSRPSLRPLLGDRLPGAPPPAHYADLDF